MTYDVLLTKKDEKFIARVRERPEIVGEGETEEEALVGGRIMQLDLDIKPSEHPWLKFAGMFTKDPD